MTTIITKIEFNAEYGDDQYPTTITAKMDGSKPDCPITLYAGGLPVFSMGENEVEHFCQELKRLVP